MFGSLLVNVTGVRKFGTLPAPVMGAPDGSVNVIVAEPDEALPYENDVLDGRVD